MPVVVVKEVEYRVPASTLLFALGGWKLSVLVSKFN